MGRARRRVRPAANTLEERGAERDRSGGDADRRRARAIRAVGVVVEQHLVDDVEVALARQYIDFLEAGRLPDAVLDLELAVLLVDDGSNRRHGPLRGPQRPGHLAASQDRRGPSVVRATKHPLHR